MAPPFLQETLQPILTSIKKSAGEADFRLSKMVDSHRNLANYLARKLFIVMQKMGIYVYK